MLSCSSVYTLYSIFTITMQITLPRNHKRFTNGTTPCYLYCTIEKHTRSLPCSAGKSAATIILGLPPHTDAVGLPPMGAHIVPETLTTVLWQ